MVAQSDPMFLVSVSESRSAPMEMNSWREQKWSGHPSASFHLGTALCRKTPLSITVKEGDGRGGRGFLRPSPSSVALEGTVFNT